MKNHLMSLKINLLNIGYAELDNTWDFDNVISPFSRLYLITKGSAHVYHNKQKFNFKPGHMYLIPSYTYSRYKCDLYHEQYYISFVEEVGNGLSSYNLEDFNYETKATYLDELYFKRLLEINPNRRIINNNPKIYDNQPALYNFNKNNELLTANNYIETQGILKVLFSRFINNNPSSVKKINKSNFKNVQIYISEHLHENLTVEKLANISNLSKDYFSRTFHEKFGIPPNKYIQYKRIERAQLLLLTTFDSLKQISEKVGLENTSYFSRIFKKATGKTPSHFRKEQLNV
jgi:AraC-like DNA-binding protein